MYSLLKEYKFTGNFKLCCENRQTIILITKTAIFVLTAVRTSNPIILINDIVKINITRKVHSFYLNNSVPTTDKILAAVYENSGLPSFRETTPTI
jgi:hypothetical protein